MGDQTEGNLNQETEIQPKVKRATVSAETLRRLIGHFKPKTTVEEEKETLENLTGGPTVPVEDLTEQGKSPISPLDDFMKPKGSKE